MDAIVSDYCQAENLDVKRFTGHTDRLEIETIELP